MGANRKSGLAAFTLIELVAVVAVMAIVAVVVAPRLGAFMRRARITRAEADLSALRQAIASPDGGYVADMSGIPGFHPSGTRLGNLLVSTNLYVFAERNSDGSYPTAERADPAGGRATPERGLACSEEYTGWSDELSRGWRGPYVAPPHGSFPAASHRRFVGDATAAERGFFPSVARLYLAADARNALDDCSVYGFPGEPAVIDPWGNPYVLQVPPPQAFSRRPAKVSPEVRWRYARLVSAGPDGFLQTPCFYENNTNTVAATQWVLDAQRLSRQAGRMSVDDVSLRGDDIVLFINRSDVDEGEEAWND